MRILTGTLKGRRLPEPLPTTRPTSERGREMIFNILTHSALRPEGSPFGTLAGCRVLDVFAGTGALGLEALSRGADSVGFVESSLEATENLKEWIHQAGLKDRTQVWTMDGRRLPKAPHQSDIILMDPPYGSGLETDVLRGLESQGWVGEGALLVLETPMAEAAPLFPHWIPMRWERCGIARLSFFKISSEICCNESAP